MTKDSELPYPATAETITDLMKRWKDEPDIELIKEALDKAYSAGRSEGGWCFDMDKAPDRNTDYLGCLGLWGYNYPDDLHPTYGVAIIGYDFKTGKWEPDDDGTPISAMVAWKPIMLDKSNDELFIIFKQRKKPSPPQAEMG